MSKGKVTIIILINGSITKRIGGNVKVELNFSSYATKAELTNAAGVDTSNLAAKSDLAGLKAEVDKIDIDQLKTFPVDLRKLSKVVNNGVIKKTVW